MPTIKPITKPPTPHEKINVAANQPKAPKTMPNTPPNVTRPINLPKNLLYHQEKSTEDKNTYYCGNPYKG